MAPQLTATQGPLLRWLQACRARAASSLPVPDSPVMSTGAMLGATLRMRSRTCCMAGDWPIMRSSMPQQGSVAALPGGQQAGVVAPGGGRPWVAEATTRRNCCKSTGLVR